MLGEDFESWNTDCIYYRDSKKNREIVHGFFDMHNMLYKQLAFNSMEFFDEKEFIEEDAEDDTETTSK